MSWLQELKTIFVPIIGNLSIQYHYNVLSIAVVVITMVYFPAPAWQKNFLLGLVFSGSVVGMLTLGYLADLVGRRYAMLTTLSLTILGSVLSGLFSWGSPDTVFVIIGIARFILGVGVGGLYPLAASSAAESSKKTGESNDDGTLAAAIEQERNFGKASEATMRVAKSFFWQSPGTTIPYIVAIFLLLAFRPVDTADAPEEAWRAHVVFRSLLAGGALLTLIGLVVEWRKPVPTEAFRASEVSPNLYRDLMTHSTTMVRLFGTTTAWFLFDVAYYGTAIFTPIILSSIFGSTATPIDTCLRTIIVSGCGIFGSMAGVGSLYYLDGRMMNVAGFVLQSFAFAVFFLVYLLEDNFGPCPGPVTATPTPLIDTTATPVLALESVGSVPFMSGSAAVLHAAMYTDYMAAADAGSLRSTSILTGVNATPLPPSDPNHCIHRGENIPWAYAKFIVFCFTMFALNYGANIGTYITAASAFPAPIRGTCHGIASAGAKIGAVVGTFMFPPVNAAGGVKTVLVVQIFCCILGAVVSLLCLKGTDAPAPEAEAIMSADKDEVAGRQVNRAPNRPLMEAEAGAKALPGARRYDA